MTQKTTYFLVVKLIKNNSVQCNAWGNAMHMGYFSALFALAKWVIIIVFLIVFPIAFEPQLFLKIASIKDNDIITMGTFVFVFALGSSVNRQNLSFCTNHALHCVLGCRGCRDSLSHCAHVLCPSHKRFVEIRFWWLPREKWKAAVYFQRSNNLAWTAVPHGICG